MSYNIKTKMYEGYIYKIYNDINDKIYIGQTRTTVEERWKNHLNALRNEKRSKSALYSAMRKYGKNNFHIKELKKVEEISENKLIEILNNFEKEYIIKFNSLVSGNGYNIEQGGNNKRVPGRTVHKYDLNLNYICSYISCEEAGRQNSIDGCTIYGCCKHNHYTAGGFIWSFDGEEPIKPIYKDREYIKKEKKYVSKAMPKEEKRLRKLENIGWNGQKVYQYNSYGELLNVYSDWIEACEQLNISTTELKKNLFGKNLRFKKYVLRNENDKFDKFPRSKELQPITIYDLQGNFIKNFECIIDAEKFLNVPRGEVLKTIKRGGSCKNYLISFYGEKINRKVYQWNKTILMCDSLGNVIKEFNGFKEINSYFEVVDCHHCINKAINNNSLYKNYYWKYKKEFAISA